LLDGEFHKEYYVKLREFLRTEYTAAKVYPYKNNVMYALKTTACADVKCVIVGQDPYHGEGQAHGLSFSVLPGAKVPPSLKNIFKEIMADVGGEMPADGHLERWATQGVLLLNNVLTVRAGQPRSHANKGWEQFTDAVLDVLDKREKPIVFLLWGRDAQQKGRVITAPQHLVLTAAHPSPLAGGAFFGCKHFSKANAFLQKHAQEPILW
jgi:uracil-DNA glycosylase